MEIVRVAVGVLLILCVFPPISIGVLNVFVLMPGVLGVAVILWPFLTRALRNAAGGRYGPVMTVVYVVLGIAGVLFAAGVVAILAGGRPQTPPKGSVAIVLGAKVDGNTPSLILMGRIAAAAGYLENEPAAPCIASGGQGSDETRTEASAIREWLAKEYHIGAERIYMDGASENTAQNIDNAAAILKAKGLGKNVVIVSDGFHLFRAKLLAKRRGLNACGLPARTDARLIVPLTIREVFALPKSILFNK